MPHRAIPVHYLDGYAEILADVSVTGRRLFRQEVDQRRELGERAARAGLGLRELIRAHLAAAREAWPELPGVTGAAGTRQISSAAGCVLAATEQAVDALAEGYERAQLVAVRRDEAARREFIDDLLHGRSDLGELSARAERFGLQLAHTHTVAVAWGDQPHDDTDPLTRRVETALTTRFGPRRVLLTTKDARLVCVAPGHQPDVVEYFAEQARVALAMERTSERDVRVAIGRAHPGPGGVVQSYEEALTALELADKLRLQPVVLRAAELLVFPVLNRDRHAMADLVSTVLGPLRGARGGPRELVRTLDAYFDSGCVAAEAARRLSLSVRAFTYRLKRIEQLTGADPSDSFQRYTLQTAVIGARLLGWPDQEL
ncbi:helix-turn-helix domain-containing protein [Streptomyces sp. DSM 44915]|uniref:Helix-turn-helix domain-containing protein n=1 Tax=Streptomyces chisholmiae TaxID=3075540 RepID=A0ABU2JTZ8_9ACTN|nr:helix-turn-helix domain-containing protein [Streptomyces sp. DSM 44915]MDT0268454.1 helix-turn-helix domain-containing protein [Streptomyces sp. DSM 44915]